MYAPYMALHWLVDLEARSSGRRDNWRLVIWFPPGETYCVFRM